MGHNLIKLITAIALAVGAVLVLHGAVWVYALWRANNELTAKLQALKPYGVSYTEVSQGGYPSRVMLTVHGLSLRRQQAGQQLDYQVGDVTFETNLTGDLHIAIQLPHSHQLAVQTPQGRRVYDVLIEGGQVATYPAADLAELAINARSVSVFSRTGGGQRVPVLYTKDLFINRVAPADQPRPREWELRLATGPLTLAATGQTYESFVLDLSLRQLAEASVYEGLLRSLAAPPAQQRQVWVDFWQQAHTERAEINLNNFRLRQGPVWLTLRGDLVVDRQLQLSGKLSFNTNNLGPALSQLALWGLVSPNTTNATPFLAKVGETGRGLTALGFTLNQGEVRLGGLPAGQVPTFMPARVP